MRAQLPPEIERGRITGGPLASQPGTGPNGRFIITSPEGIVFQVIASDGGGWEHVSVTTARKKRCLTWEEMCFIKNLFWDPDEDVIQYHPARKDYINVHPTVLHLWKPIGIELPKPPKWMV